MRRPQVRSRFDPWPSLLLLVCASVAPAQDTSSKNTATVTAAVERLQQSLRSLLRAAADASNSEAVVAIWFSHVRWFESFLSWMCSKRRRGSIPALPEPFLILTNLVDTGPVREYRGLKAGGNRPGNIRRPAFRRCACQFLTLSSLLRAVNMEYNRSIKFDEINRLRSG